MIGQETIMARALRYVVDENKLTIPALKTINVSEFLYWFEMLYQIENPPSTTKFCPVI